MNKPEIFVASALLAFALGAPALAADPPTDPSTTVAQTTQAPGPPTVGPKEDQRAIDTSPPKSAKSSTKHKKKHKPATAAPATPAPATPPPATGK